jgi:hypothetical protein
MGFNLAFKGLKAEMSPTCCQTLWYLISECRSNRLAQQITNIKYVCLINWNMNDVKKCATFTHTFTHSDRIILRARAETYEDSRAFGLRFSEKWRARGAISGYGQIKESGA